MNGRKIKHRKQIRCGGQIRRRRQSRSACLIAAVIWAAMPTAAAELGGFDVEVEPGENWEFPPGWEDDRQEPQQNGQEDIQEDIREDIQGGDGYQEPLDENGTGGESGGWQENNSRQEDTQGGWEGNEGTGSDSPWQSLPGGQGGSRQEDGSVVPVTESGAAPTLTPVPIPPPTVTPAPTYAESPTPAPTPPPRQPAAATPSPASTAGPALTGRPRTGASGEAAVTGPGIGPGPFTYYDREKQKNTGKRAGKDYPVRFVHDGEAVSGGAAPWIEVQSEGAVQILSLLFNGEECPWHWEEDFLVPEEETRRGENKIELLAVSEDGRLIEMEPWLF